MADLVDGERRAAKDKVERAEIEARVAHERNAVLQALAWQTQMALADGGYRRAIECAREADALSSQIAHRFLGDWANGLHAIACWRMGDEALALEIAHNGGGITKRNEPILPVLRVLIYGGETTRALEILERIEPPRPRRPRCDAMQIQALTAHALTPTDPDRARQLLIDAAQIQASAIPEIAAQAHLDRALAWHGLDDATQGAEAARAGIRALGNPPPIGLAFELALVGAGTNTTDTSIWAETLVDLLTPSEAVTFQRRTGVQDFLTR
jgi:hypothetical protein